MPTSDYESRVATLEEGLRGLTMQLAAVDQATGRLRDEVVRVGQPDWQILIAGAILFMAILSAALIPNYLMAEHASGRAEEALTWQRDYQQGRIPSVAEPKLAAFEATFAKIEGQFETTHAKIDANDRLMRTRTAFTVRHVERLRADVDQLERTLAWLTGKDGRGLRPEEGPP